MPSYTTNYSIPKPSVGGDKDAWGSYLNNGMDIIDAQMKTNATAAAAAQTTANNAVPKSGGTMTGFLTLSANPTNANHAATKTYVDTQDNLRLALAGGTMTGALTLSGAPTLNLHAATKAYADTKLSASGGTISGTLTVTGALTTNSTLDCNQATITNTNPYINLVASAAGNHRATVNFYKSATAKWQLGTDLGNNDSNDFYMWDNVANKLRFQIDATANLKFDSGYGSAATAYGCRAWAAITGSTGAVRDGSASFTCTRTGVGVYTIGFPAMPDTNYSVTVTCEDNATYPGNAFIPIVLRGTRTTTQCQIRVNGATNVAVDPDSLFVTIHR